MGGSGAGGLSQGGALGGVERVFLTEGWRARRWGLWGWGLSQGRLWGVWSEVFLTEARRARRWGLWLRGAFARGLEMSAKLKNPLFFYNRRGRRERRVFAVEANYKFPKNEKQ